MREENIEKMNFKELRNEVQYLRDELAILTRKFNDAIYNLDSDNFGKSFTVAQDNMKAQIKINAKEIATKVSTADMNTAISQTADAIQSVVSKGANLKNAVEVESTEYMTDTSEVYVIREYLDGIVVGETYYCYNSLLESWKPISGDSIYTVFTQTAEGFELKGNTIIDGDAVVTRNLTLSGNVTWDMSNSPVQTKYAATNSASESDWHSYITSGDQYMKMSFDGGRTWSNALKVVGTDGHGASVSPKSVFDALTDNVAKQGIFSAFIESQDKIYINAEYIYGLIGQVAKTLYIGDTGNVSESKSITFSSGVNLHTILSTGAYTGLEISANRVDIATTGGSTINIGTNNSLAARSTINPGRSNIDFSNCNITWGNNAPVAVFG